VNDTQTLKHLALNGNCAGQDTELFFEPENSRNYLKNNYKTIQKICGSCPVQQDCLGYALRHDVEGIWGGKYHSERIRLRKQLGITAEPVSFNQFVTKFKDPYHEQLLWEYIDSHRGVCIHGHELKTADDVIIGYRERYANGNPNFHCRRCNRVKTDKHASKKAAALSTEPSRG
jgi:hypothetical protein